MTKETTKSKSAVWSDNTFPNAGEVIRFRAAMLFGNLTGLANFAGISRQALDRRLKSAQKWPLSHAWFQFVLALPEPLWCYTTADAASVPIPDETDLATRKKLHAEVWRKANTNRRNWSSAGAFVSILSGGAAAVSVSDVGTNDNNEGL